MDPPNSPRHAFADEGRVGDAGDGIDGVATGLRARWLLDAMSDMVGLLSPHGAVLELNACGLELAALTRSEAVGRKLWELDAWYRSEAARRRAHSMQAQVDQLLTAAQLEAGRLELVLVPCDLAALVRRVAAGFESVAGAHGVSLEVDTSPSVIVVADPQRVASAITNLVSNALNATPREGCVRVELRERRGKARLEVSDTGAGVP